MDKNKLIIYEMPCFAQYISNDLFQEYIARYVAWKVNRKMKRYKRFIQLLEKYNK